MQKEPATKWGKGVGIGWVACCVWRGVITWYMVVLAWRTEGRQKCAKFSLLDKFKFSVCWQRARKACYTQTQLLDCFCAGKPLTVDRLSEGGLFRNGVHVPCMEGFSVCQNCLIFSTFTPDSCLSLSTHSSISSGLLFLTSTILLLPFTKTQKTNRER